MLTCMVSSALRSEKYSPGCSRKRVSPLLVRLCLVDCWRHVLTWEAVMHVQLRGRAVTARLQRALCAFAHVPLFLCVYHPTF